MGGGVDVQRPNSSEATIYGWAMIPGKMIPADGLFICKRGKDGALTPLGMLVIGRARPDVVDYYHKPSLLYSGCHQTIDLAAAESIAAFSVDEKAKCMYPVWQTPW